VAMARPDPTASLPEALRAALGEATFARAWRAGQALTGARASAEAMSALTVARARPPTPPRGDGLSRREAEVVALIAAGLSNRAIATHLSLSIRTVERHITNLYGKIGARGRADATVYALTVIGPGGHARAPGEDRARRG
jgi:DNA-binding NarL/FixJ family response regulator